MNDDVYLVVEENMLTKKNKKKKKKNMELKMCWAFYDSLFPNWTKRSFCLNR